MDGEVVNGDRHHPLRELEDSDLVGLLEEFYTRLAEDDLLAAYFTELDMTVHMPRIVAFWSTILFGTGRYHDNAFAPHLEMPDLTPERFERWVSTLESVVTDDYSGDKANRMIESAHRIAYSMQLRLGLQPFAPYRPATHGVTKGPRKAD